MTLTKLTLPPRGRSLLGAALAACVCLSAGGCKDDPPPPVPPATPAPQTTVPAATEQDPDSDPPTPVRAAIAPPQSTDPELLVQRVVRSASVIPEHDEAALERAGIRKYESPRMILYTDIEPEIARTLPPLIDQIYPQWEAYFGPLRPAVDDSDFRLVGYLMRDGNAYRRLGLVPDDLPYFTTGRHRLNQFWMVDQATDYYRRHLFLHEATHCFMTIVPETKCPIWYLEGTAELFGTHRLDEAGTLETRAIPRTRSEFPGWGRITLIEQMRSQGRLATLSEVLAIDKIDPERETNAYAWCWGLCYFLESHPRYRERFRSLREHWHDGSFKTYFLSAYEPDLDDLRREWLFFAWNLTEGYDVAAAAIEFPESPRPLSEPAKIAAARGWQSTGWELDAGDYYEITVDGLIVLANDPKPWNSEAQGVTVEYADGRPLGRVIGLVLDDSPAALTSTRRSGDELARLLTPFDIGKQLTFRAPRSGTLYLRVNDRWDSLSDNAGEFRATIRKVDGQ